MIFESGSPPPLIGSFEFPNKTSKKKRCGSQVKLFNDQNSLEVIIPGLFLVLNSRVFSWMEDPVRAAAMAAQIPPTVNESSTYYVENSTPQPNPAVYDPANPSFNKMCGVSTPPTMPHQQQQQQFTPPASYRLPVTEPITPPGVPPKTPAPPSRRFNQQHQQPQQQYPAQFPASSVLNSATSCTPGRQPFTKPPPLYFPDTPARKPMGEATILTNNSKPLRIQLDDKTFLEVNEK